MATKIDDIPRIVNSLRDTFKLGITKNDLEYRKTQLRNLKRFIIENQQELLDAVYKDLHKHHVETMAAEVSPVLGEIEYMLTNLGKLAKTQVVKPHYAMNSTSKCTIRKEPKGVVLVIGSWNFPINLLLLPVVGAIAAGNCVIIKPSEVSEHTADVIGQLLPSYLDSNAYAVVQGGVEETTHLLKQKFEHIFYTGSGNIGKIVMAAAAKNLTPVTLELGGKSPVIIAPDANLKMTANRVMWGKLFNCGQVCVAPDYVVISKHQLSEFVEHCKDSIKAMYGENPKESDSYCRLVSERRYDVLKDLLQRVEKEQIVFGGEGDREDLYIAPTIVAPVESNDHPLMEDEIFGPILPILPVEGIDEAISIINKRDAPLALYIFSNDQNTREKILNNTQSGSAVINDIMIQVQESSMPFGGTGASGMGAYHGKKSFETFTHERSTMIQTPHFESTMAVRYPPYTENKAVLFNLLTCGLPDGFMNKVKAIYSACGSAKSLMFSKKNQQKQD